MYVVRILYPRTEDSDFNLKHYIEVHSPLGLGLLKSECDVIPVRVEIDTGPLPLGDNPPPFHCASHLYFSELAHVEAFKSLFAREDTAKLLSDDFELYTTNHPVISISELTNVDPITHAPR